MLEDENNGVHSPETIGNGVADPKTGRKKRVLTKDLSERISELEKKLEASAGIQEQVAALTEQITKLDERVSKIAHAVAQLNLRPAGLA
jgi:predicted  nucleic acid-binding Zn-ribbon protein